MERNRLTGLELYSVSSCMGGIIIVISRRRDMMLLSRYSITMQYIVPTAKILCTRFVYTDRVQGRKNDPIHQPANVHCMTPCSALVLHSCLVVCFRFLLHSHIKNESQMLSVNGHIYQFFGRSFGGIFYDDLATLPQAAKWPLWALLASFTMAVSSLSKFKCQ